MEPLFQVFGMLFGFLLSGLSILLFGAAVIMLVGACRLSSFGPPAGNSFELGVENEPSTFSAANAFGHLDWLCAHHPVAASLSAFPKMAKKMLDGLGVGFALFVLGRVALWGVDAPSEIASRFAYKLAVWSSIAIAVLFSAYALAIFFHWWLRRIPAIGKLTMQAVEYGHCIFGTVIWFLAFGPGDNGLWLAGWIILDWSVIAYFQAWFFAAAEQHQGPQVAEPADSVFSRLNANGSSGASGQGGAWQFTARKARFDGKDVEGMETVFSGMTEAMKIAAEKTGSSETKNGLLLYGKPGGGKTFLVEAAAGELKLPLINVDIGKVTSMWVGETTQHVTKVFDEAKAQAPCVLFIDEADSLLIDRGKITQAESETARVVNTFLTRAVDLRGKGVVLIAATNYLDRLDPAAVREGRFDWKIEIPMPDVQARIGLLCRGLAASNKIASQETLERMSRHWEGFNVARMKSIAEQACKAVEGPEVTGTELMNAYLSIRPSLGDTLPESTPDLNGVYLPEAECQKLAGLAKRMAKLIEIEEMGGTIPSGVLFCGPSGTGKSLTARALAKETRWSFLSYNSPDLLVSPKAIDEMLDRARDARPAIVFLDEADDLLMDRNISQNRQITNKLLAAMDGSSRVPDVIFLAATNHPDLLDQAMLRGGRFGQKIEFSLPDSAMVSRYLADKNAAKPMPLKDISIVEMAQILNGLSFANIEEALKSAINNNIDEGGGGFITKASLKKAL